jgi:hypothetical protein
MVTTRTATISTLILSLIVSIRLGAQTANSNTSFIIDLNRPYVYLKFDHIGPGIPRNEEELKTRIWLRLMNNCRVPIVVLENGTPDGSPKDERQIMFEVVPTTMPKMGLPRFGQMGEASESRPEESAEQSRRGSQKMPPGYISEVGSSESIPPGKGILFSISVNHLSKRWRIEIPYTFDLPQGRCCRDPNIGGEPKMVVEYSLWDLPPKFLSQIHRE